MSHIPHFSIYECWPEDESFRDSWNSLVLQADFPNVFLTWEWTSIWWKWFGKTSQLRLFVVWNGSDILGIAPFYVTTHRLLKVFRGQTLRWIGDGALVCPDFLGPIVKPADAPRFAEMLALEWKTLVKRGEFAIFSDCLISLAGTRTLLESLTPPGRMHRQDGAKCPYLSLPPTYEEFLNGLGGRQRESIRRRMRKACKTFDVELKCVKTSQEFGSFFDLVKNIYVNSERGQASDACFLNEQYFGFHQDIGEAFSQCDWLRLYIIYFDGVPVAFIYGYLYGSRFWFYQTAFMAKYRKHGPGSILMQLVIAAAIEEGAKTFEFLRGDEPYKYHFADRQRTTETVAIFPGNSTASVLYRVDNLLRGTKNDILRRISSAAPARLSADFSSKDEKVKLRGCKNKLLDKK